MTFESFAVYFIILFVATITPGPSMLLAINHGVNYGLSRATLSCLGNLFGNLLMASASILGLGAVIMASGVVFNIIKWIGIIYLVFIGIKLIFEPIKTGQFNNNHAIKKSPYRLFIDGFLVAIGNPKGILFFTALFPQFINSENVQTNKLIVLLITLSVVAFGCYMLYVIFGVRLNHLLHLQTFRKLFNRITGSVFVCTGITIAISRK